MSIKGMEVQVVDYDETQGINPKPLKNKVAMITGASRGIGAAIADLFARAGAALILTELNERMEDLHRFSDQLESRYQVNVLRSSLDITRHEEIGSLMENVRSVFGQIDILVNNAGINMLTPSLSITPEQWDRIVDVNLKGNFFVTQEVAKLMVLNKRGSIIFIASQHGVVGNELRAPYCASKAALIHLCKSLAVEWSKYGIRINAVSPTFVETDSNVEIVRDSNFTRVQLPRIPLRRFATPEDIAEAVLYLAANTSSMVTGHNLIVDGGWTAQ